MKIIIRENLHILVWWLMELESVFFMLLETKCHC